MRKKHTVRFFCFLLFVFMVLRVYACFTLLYEIASNSSLICAGVWISSSLDDRGWEEARASIANTLWMSPSTMRSVYYKTNETVYLTTLSSTNTYIQNNLVLMKFLPQSTQVQHYLLPSTQHRMQSLHSATSHSTIWVSPDYQTTRGTVQKKMWELTCAFELVYKEVNRICFLKFFIHLSLILKLFSGTSTLFYDIWMGVNGWISQAVCAQVE